jgi:hypothetical protein
MSDPLLNTTEKKTAFNPQKPPTTAGGFTLGKLELTNAGVARVGPGADKIDLRTSVWHELNLYEDIYSPIISGDITLTDTIGMIESFPIIGEEILEISFSTAGAAIPPIPVSGGPPNLTPAPSPSEAPKQIINRFRVYKVDPPVQVTDNSRTIKLYFVTDSQFTNLLSKVRKIYPEKKVLPPTTQSITDKSYTHADMARDIFYDFFINETGKKPPNQPKTRKPFLIEPTRYNSEVIIPNWNPFKAISFLASKAVSANPATGGANFVFYQTLQGFRFVSIETLMLGGFRLFKEITPDEVVEKFPHLEINAISTTAATDNSSHLPIFDAKEIRDISAEKPYVASYKYMPANMGETKQSLYEAVTSYKLVESFDTMKNVALGMYANRVITHDLIQMKIDRKDFYYVKPPRTITVKEADGSETTKILPEVDPEKTQFDTSVSTEAGRLCSDTADFLNRPEAHISLVSTNLGQAGNLNAGPRKEITGYGKDNFIEAKSQSVHDRNGFGINEDIKETHVEDIIARRISQRLQLDGVKINFSALGDSSREVGDLISFDYPTEDPETAASRSGFGVGHKYYSGKFLITALRHQINRDEYTIHAEAIKDGYRSSISSGFGLTDPVVQVPDQTSGLTENQRDNLASMGGQNSTPGGGLGGGNDSFR